MGYTWKQFGKDLDTLQFEKILGYSIPLSRMDREDGRKRENYGLWILPSKGLVVEADSFSTRVNRANLHCELELPQPVHLLVDGVVFDKFMYDFGSLRVGGGPCREIKEDKGYCLDLLVESNPAGIISRIENGPYPLRSPWKSWRDHTSLRFYDTHIWSQLSEAGMPSHLHHSATNILRERVVASLPMPVRIMLGEN